MDNGNASLGKASLWTSIIGIALPVCLVVLGAVIFLSLNSQVTTLCAVLSVILELVAFGCGIAARRTATGKAGLVISSVVLLLAGLVVFIALKPK